MSLLHIISLNLPKLYDCHYSSLVTKYFLHTSILLDPSCSSVESSETSLCAYSKNIYIKKPTKSSLNQIYKIMLRFYDKFIKSQEKTPTISFVVPFPKICKYHDHDYNPWNEILYKQKSILFCNIDSDNFYKWWNFAAIIDFKWNTFGKFIILQFGFFILFFLFVLH